MRIGRTTILGLFVLLMVCMSCVTTALADTIDGTTFETTMITDKEIYSPGDTITYKIWVDLTSTTGNDIDHIVNANIVIDPNVETISHNFNYVFPLSAQCNIIDNSVVCQSGTDYMLWFTPSPYHGFLNNNGPADFTITGKIKSSTPLGTTLTSTASFSCMLVATPSHGIGDKSTSQVTVGGIPTPEFPSTFLPATMIIGMLGAVLLIQRTREH